MHATSALASARRPSPTGCWSPPMHGGEVGSYEAPLAFDGQQQKPTVSSTPPPQQKTMIAHCGFKAAALITYLLSGFGSGYVVTFVMVTIFSALDFWTGTFRASVFAAPCRAMSAHGRSFCARACSQKCVRPAPRGAAMVQCD